MDKDAPEIALIPRAPLYLLQGALFMAEEEPEKAFQVALKLNRGMIPAHRWLACIFHRLITVSRQMAADRNLRIEVLNR